jgi:transcriptional regulator
VVDDYTYIRSDWNAGPGAPAERGVPTSYYATVQLACDVRLVDDPEEKAAVLDRQLGHFEPGSARLPVSAEEDPDRRLLPGIRGIELTVTGVRAKFKYGGNKTAEHVREIADRLEERGTRADIAAREHALRRV